jgi:hypothetical protein
VISVWIIIYLWVADPWTVVCWWMYCLTSWLLFINQWRSTGSVQYTPLHHKMSGYEGIINDIMKVCWFLIGLPLSSIEMMLHQTIHLLCWWIICLNSDSCAYFYVHLQIWIQIPVIKRYYCWRFSYPTCNYSLWI